MFKIQMIQTEGSFRFRYLNFGFVSDFDIRISDFLIASVAILSTDIV
jgi:hypothetical protein